MCGRYVLELALEHPQYLAGLELRESIVNYNVAPTASVPILVDRLDAGGSFVRELHAARWGLLPSWAQDPSFASRAFNARSETIFEKPTFREAAVAGHCALPVTGYYEWKTETTAAGKSVKTPYLVHRADGQPIYLAGLYSWWRIPAEYAAADGLFPHQEGQWLLTCSIVTMDAPGHGEFAQQVPAEPPGAIQQQLGQLHNRLPIPLAVADDAAVSEADTLTAWLRAGRPAGSPKPAPEPATSYRADAQASLQMIRERAFDTTEGWQLRPVSKDVGNVRNNGPYLLEPAEDLLTGLTTA